MDLVHKTDQRERQRQRKTETEKDRDGERQRRREGEVGSLTGTRSEVTAGGLGGGPLAVGSTVSWGGVCTGAGA